MCCNGNLGNLGKDIQYQDRTSPDCPEPFAQVCISCPPPCPIPLCPCPVKPLQLPCPQNYGTDGTNVDDYVANLRSEPNSRYDNFYNNYNIDWHADGTINQPTHNGGHQQYQCLPPRSNGTTVDGQSPCCENYQAQMGSAGPYELPGCPTGFKPCKLKLQPPPCCDPCGCWTAHVQNCPPKPKQKDKKYTNDPCTRPCCLHWEDKGGPCLYDDPCKAHCFNHPPGIKPSGRFP